MTGPGDGKTRWRFLKKIGKHLYILIDSKNEAIPQWADESQLVHN